MIASNLDSLEKELPPPTARAILAAMDRELAERGKDLATKADLAVLKGELIGEIKDLKIWGLGLFLAQTALFVGLLKFHW